LSASPGLAPTPAHPDEPHPDETQPEEAQPDDAQQVTIFPPLHPRSDDGRAGREPTPIDLNPIPLPDVRWNGRARRRRELRMRRRRRFRRTSLVLGAVVLAVVVVAVLAGPVGRLLNERAENTGRPKGAGPSQAPTAAPPAPAVAPVLLAHRDGSGRTSSLTVLAASATGKGGSLVMIPPGTMTEVVSLGLEPVRQSLELGGPARLQATVENLLGTRLGAVVVLDDAGVASLLAPVGSLPVTVPQRVERVGQSGRVEVLYEAGPTTVAPSAAGRFLSAKGRESDLARLTRHQAFWDAWLAVLHDRPSALPTRPDLSAAVAALAAGPVETRPLPVEAFGSASDGGGELYKVRADELARLVAAVFPAAGQALADRPRVQVLNGTGVVELADAVRDKLGAGFDVRLTGNAATFDYEHTEIVYYDRDQEATADRLRQVLGVGTLVLSRRPLDVVDVTVVVGKDFQH